MRWAKALATQGYGGFPVTPDWKVTIDPKTFTLAANQETQVKVELEYLLGTFIGQQRFNLHVFASSPYEGREMVGGVTLIVEG